MADEAVSVGLKADSKSFVRAFNEGTQAVKTIISTGKAMQDAFGRAVGHVIQDIQRMKRIAVAAGVTIGAGFATAGLLVHKSLSNFKDFESAMANVSTVAGESTATLGHMSNAVMKLTGTFPQTAEELAAGLYEVNSAGFQADEALSVLSATAMFSTAGIVDMATSVRGTASILNAYSLTAADATHVTDVMFKAVEVGQMNASEFTNQIGDWASAASSLTVPFETAAAAMAVLTTKGALLAPQAATSLAGIFRALISPSEEMGKAIKRAGFESGKAMIEAKGLTATLGDLWEASGKNETRFHEMFQDQEGFRGALSLTNAGYEMMIKTQDQFNDRTETSGTTAAAFAKQMSTMSAQGKLVSNEFRRMGYEVGQLVAPIASFTMGGTANMLKFFNSLPGPIRKTVAALQLMTPVLLAGAAIIGAWILKGLLWKKVMTSIATTNFVKLTAESGRVKKAIAEMLNSTRVKTFFLEMGKAGGPFGYVISKVKAFAVANMNLKASMLKVAASTGLYIAGFTAVVVMITSAIGAFTEAKAKANELKESFVQAGSGTFKTWKQLVDEIDRGVKAYDKAAKSSGSGFWGKLGVDLIAAGQAVTPFTDNTRLKAMAARKSMGELNQEYGRLINTVEHFGKQGKLSNDQVLQSMNQLAADGTMDVQSLIDAHEKLLKIQEDLDVQRFLSAKEAPRGRAQRGRGEPTPIDPRDFMDPKMATEWTKTNAVLEEAQEQIDALNRKIDAMKVISELGSQAAMEMASALFTIGDEASTATDRMGAFSTIIGQLLGNTMAVKDAEAGFVNSIELVGQAMVDNGGNFDLTTEGGRAVQDAMSKAASATEALAIETVKQSGHVEDAVPIVSAYAQGMIAVAQNAGFSNEQIVQMINTMGLTPDVIETLVTLPGIDPAIAQLLTTSGILGGLDGYVAQAGVNVTITTSVVPYAPGYVNKNPWLIGGPDKGGPPQPTKTAGIQDKINELLKGIVANIPKTAGKKGGGGGGGGGAEKWKPTSEQLANMREALGQPIVDMLDGDLGATWQRQLADDWFSSVTENIFSEGKTRLGASILQEAQESGTDPTDQLKRMVEQYGRLMSMVGLASADAAVAMADNLDTFTAYVDDVEALIHHQQDVEDWRNGRGEINNQEYFDLLAARLLKVAQYSDEWMSIMDKMKSVEQEMSEANKAAFNEEKRMEEARFTLGEITRQQYLVFLRDRLQYYAKYSDEWMAIWQEIQDMEKEIVDNTKSNNDAIKSFADSVKSAFDDIKRAVEDPMLSATSLIAAFGDQATMTQGQLAGFYSHMMEGTQRWVTVIKALKDQGINKNFLMELISAGPRSLGFAESVLALGSGGISMINDSMAGIADLASGLGTDIARGSVGTLNQNDNSININVGDISIVGEMPGGVTLLDVQTAITAALGGVAVQVGNRQIKNSRPNP